MISLGVNVNLGATPLIWNPGGMLDYGGLGAAPANALQDEAGNYILDEAGNYIVLE